MPEWRRVSLYTVMLKDVREKGRDLTQSYDKSPLHKQKRQKDKVTTQTTPQKSSITKRLRIDLGR